MSRASGAVTSAHEVAVRELGHAVLAWFDGAGSDARLSRSKGVRDEVTDADVALERLTRERLAVLTPDVPIVGEESGGVPGAAAYWLVDPIDGTVNFTRGHPLHAYSLALVVDGVPLLGLLVLPALAEVYDSLAAGAADRAPARDLAGVGSAVVAAGGLTPRHGGAGDRERLALLQALQVTAYRVRLSGSLAVDLLSAALGWVDASVCYAPQTWDVAAGVAVARAHGCVVLNRAGADYRIGDDLAVACRDVAVAREIVTIVAATRASSALPVEEQGLR